MFIYITLFEKQVLSHLSEFECIADVMMGSVLFSEDGMYVGTTYKAKCNLNFDGSQGTSDAYRSAKCWHRLLYQHWSRCNK